MTKRVLSGDLLTAHEPQFCFYHIPPSVPASHRIPACQGRLCAGHTHQRLRETNILGLRIGHPWTGWETGRLTLRPFVLSTFVSLVTNLLCLYHLPLVVPLKGSSFLNGPFSLSRALMGPCRLFTSSAVTLYMYGAYFEHKQEQ